jgi:TRAP-type C4-dicarboxylate transport system substrate-binding protein
MNTTTIKPNFHQLIDNIEDEHLLEQFYNALVYSSERENKLWNSLSSEEQKEVLQAYEESEQEENLLSHAMVKEQHKQWLTK